MEEPAPANFFGRRIAFIHQQGSFSAQKADGGLPVYRCVPQLLSKQVAQSIRVNSPASVMVLEMSGVLLVDAWDNRYNVFFLIW